MIVPEAIAVSTGLVFVALPRLVIEIVTQAAAAEPGVQVLGEFDDLEAAVSPWMRHGSTRSSSRARIQIPRGAGRPRTAWATYARVVAISAGGARADLVELVVETCELDTSAALVVAELRQAAIESKDPFPNRERGRRPSRRECRPAVRGCAVRKVHGTAKDEKDHGVAECRVEAFFEYHVAAADRFPALAAGAIRADPSATRW